ncbi:MAG: FAD-dependent oxidoreductase [Rhodobiaceae bacterium]|nr:FAD-dependent oxidoreductase [Rhodobiaceae bacterium]MCC0018182.1 FAD-dependent oxidoreductase [Rhodobiaceae bacterium]MCC0051252.1 FAD-dependent oxidoreductase [Rhodobiaceae bacterium]
MPERIAILGAGIMGCCLALEFARRGRKVTVFDERCAPMECASRWNEGKLHLGYLYANDPSLATARHMLPAGLAFLPIMRDWIGEAIDTAISHSDDLYLVSRGSVVGAAATGAYFEQVTALAKTMPGCADYPGDLTRAAVRQASRSDLERHSNACDIVAGYFLPERSIQTRWVADRLADRVTQEPFIELRMGQRVEGVDAGESGHDPWTVRTLAVGDTGEATREAFGLVVNALWQGRVAVDRTAGIADPADCSNRFRVSAFVRTSKPLAVPSAIICVGPFGDMKNYNGRDFYLSWYPTGLLRDTKAAVPGAAPVIDSEIRAAVLRGIQKHLVPRLPGAGQVLEAAERIEVAGGWIFAQASGVLADPSATLHRRERFGVSRIGNFLSVDTGKYATAPHMAREIVSMVMD